MKNITGKLIKTNSTVCVTNINKISNVSLNQYLKI